ncbi:MAG: glycoside hydrolase domain-containing protein [Janthinobacterium lividum]
MPRFLNVFPLVLLAIMTLLSPNTAVHAAPPNVAADYKVPTITVPYAWHKPTLDGIVHDDEWQDAVSFSALQTTDHTVSPRQTRFWMMWDADYLYIAMRSPLRPGERLIQALREQDKDVNSIFDDSYEIWLDANTHSPDGQPVFFQYLSNFAGARYDVMQEPAAGNSRIGWTAHWNPKNHLSADGRNWEMEMAIPRSSVYKDQPFADGFSFTALLTRNYKRPWEQNSISGSGSFSVRETHARFVLSKSAPAINLLAVADPQAQTFGLQLSARAQQSETLHWLFESDSGVQKEGDLPVSAGQIAMLPPMLDLDKPGTGNFRIKILSADKARTYFDWSAKRQWGDLTSLTQKMNDTGDQVALTLGFNPARDYLRVNGDFIDYDNRAQIARYSVAVENSSSHVIAQKDLHLDSLAYVRDIIRLPNLPPGDYTAQLTTFDKSGKALFSRDKQFAKKDPAKAFPWWNTKLGNADKVIAPWTPVRYSAGQFAVWGRTMHVGAAGLPQQVTALGRNLLAAPAYLTADLGSGKVVTAKNTALQTLSAADQRVVVQSTGSLGAVTVKSVVTTEYDGMYKVEMTLDAPKPTVVKSLRMVIPLKNETADYLHACGEGIRYGFDYRYLPSQKMGRLWDSLAVDGQPMLVGSFIPYIWIGNTQGGLCWFADSDEGWVPSSTTPAIEVRRDSAKSTDLVLNLISTATTLHGSRKITFAFQATPTKPIQPHWRMDTWWTNDSFQDWAQVESEGHAGNEGLIFSSIPFPLDPAKSKQMVDARHQQTNSGIFGFAKYRANAVPYFEHINMGEQFVPELTYFDEDWRTHVSRGLSYGKTLSDFMIYHLSHWAQDSGIDGFYVDNVSPLADDNIDAGHGYLLPDGRVQPAYQMFDTRLYFLRMRAAFAEQGHPGKIVFHMTNHMIAPWMESADIALDGEHHVIYPEMGKDFMDFWSPERLRLDYPGQWGTAVNFLQEYQGNWDPAVLKKDMRAYTGMLLLNDVLASANANSLNQEAWIARDHFGMEAGDVRFLGYWNPDRGFNSATPNITVSGWIRPGGRLLLAVVNTGEKTDADVQIDAAKLGLPSPARWKVTDAETQQPIVVDSSGSFKVPLDRHDYRQILITISD